VNVAFEGDPAVAGVYGIPRQKTSRTIAGRGWVVGTKFRPGGFAAFCRIPMPELVDGAVSLGQAFGQADGVELERAVAAHADVDGRIKAIEAFFRRRAPRPDPARALVTQIVGEMLSADPSLRVEQLAARHGLSTRALQRLFRAHVGVGPKWVLRRYRLHEATERIGAGEAHDLTALAHDLGYFDQSHFNREFRSLVGTSPTAYARMCAAASPQPAAA